MSTNETESAAADIKETSLNDYSTINGEQPEAEDTFTIDQAIDQLGFGRFQVKLTIVAGLAWTADSMEMMILSILSSALRCQWWLSGFQQALITTVVFGGMMTSSTLWGNFSDKYGRKAGLILSALVTLHCGILSALSPNFVWLLILRGLVGFGIGGIPQVVTLYAEFLPSAHRAKAVVLLETFWTAGALLEAILAFLIVNSFGWRLLLFVSSFPLIIFVICGFWLPESARYQLACGDVDSAYKTLQRVADENGKPMPLGRLVEHATPNVHRGRVCDLFIPELRVTTLLVWFIWFTSAFGYYGIVIFSTTLFAEGDACHGGTGPANQPSCPLECHGLTQNDYLDLCWTTIAEVPGLLITVSIIEYLGRKKTLAIDFFLFAIFVCLLFLCSGRIVLTIFIFLARAAINGGFQAIYVYTAEVYPTAIRALGMGSGSCLSRLGSLVTPFVAQVASTVSLDIPIAIYAFAGLAGGIASLLLPIETRGREI